MGAALALSERRRILLVDDVELNRILTEAVLRAATYEVDSVSDGVAALAALEDKTYDLVLMDLEMPGLGGHEAANEIRRRETRAAKTHAVKLAAISSKNTPSIRLRSAEVGMAAHIVRPIVPHELLRQIERVFCQPAIGTEPDPWNRQAYDEWASRLGTERMRTFLRSLLDQFRQLLMLLAARAPTDELHRLAHDVSSTGGMLGFPSVTRCCRALLEAPDAATDASSRLELTTTLEGAIARLDRHFLSIDQVAEAA